MSGAGTYVASQSFDYIDDQTNMLASLLLLPHMDLQFILSIVHLVKRLCTTELVHWMSLTIASFTYANKAQLLDSITNNVQELILVIAEA